MLGLTFSSKLDQGSYIISIAKTASKKIGTLIHSVKFLSPEIDLYLCKSALCPCMKYCCHIWAGAPSFCQISYKNGYSGLSVLHLLSLWNPWLIVKMQLPEGFSVFATLVDFHLNWLNLFYFFFLEGGLLVILIDCIIFLSPFLDATRMSMSTVSFCAQLDSAILCLQNALPAIQMVLSLELTDTNYRFFLKRLLVIDYQLQVLSKEITHILFLYFFFL